MFTGVRGYVARHRSKVALGAGVTGALYVAGQQAWATAVQSREEADNIRRGQQSIEQRFHAITSHCHITVLGLLPGVVQAICTALPVDSIIDELQRQRRAPQQSSRPANPDCLSDCPGSPIRVSVADGLSSPLFTGSDRASADCQGEVPTRSKVELWQELKINVIARTVALSHISALLTVMTHIQLSILAREPYGLMGTPPSSESDVHVTARADNDRELSRQYLSISWWLLEQGSRELLADILAATHVIFDSLSPRTKLTVAQFRAHVTSVTCEAEAIAKTRGGEERWLPYLLPRSCYDHSLSNQVPDSEAAMPYEALLRHPQLQALLDETADIIESPGFGITNTALIDYSLELLIRETPGTTTDGVTRLEADRRPIESLKNPQGISMEDVSTTLAALVISTSKTLIHHLETGQDSYLGTLFEVPALQRFSATVFSSNMSHKDQSMQLSVAAAVSKKPEAPSVSSETYLEQRPSITQEDEGTDFDSFQRAWTSSGASRHIL